MHTCGHPSDRPYIELCRPGIVSNTVCPGIKEDEKYRPSHFPCYACIKAEARAEIEARARMEQDAMIKANQARELALKQRQAAELKAKQERIRREASEKAAREREVEERAKREKEAEELRAQKEGGPWIESLGSKKYKVRRNVGGTATMDSPPRLLNPLSVSRMATGPKNIKDNSNGTGDDRRSKASSVDLGGRAGFWGPKKILTRQENNAGAGLVKKP